MALVDFALDVLISGLDHSSLIANSTLESRLGATVERFVSFTLSVPQESVTIEDLLPGSIVVKVKISSLSNENVSALQSNLAVVKDEFVVRLAAEIGRLSGIEVAQDGDIQAQILLPSEASAPAQLPSGDGDLGRASSQWLILSGVAALALVCPLSWLCHCRHRKQKQSAQEDKDQAAWLPGQAAAASPKKKRRPLQSKLKEEKAQAEAEVQCETKNDIGPNAGSVASSRRQSPAGSHAGSPRQYMSETSPSGSSPKKDQSAVEAPKQLVKLVFEAMDKAGSGWLGENDMFFFAHLTGFEGTPEHFTTTYQKLCKDFNARPEQGLDLEKFDALVNNQSSKGCPFTEDELIALVRGHLLRADTEKDKSFEETEICTEHCGRCIECLIPVSPDLALKEVKVAIQSFSPREAAHTKKDVAFREDEAIP